MRELTENITNLLRSHFHGKEVGSGGDFGATLPVGPFTIGIYLTQWQDIKHPSIHIQPIQERTLCNSIDGCCGGTELILNIRISAYQKPSGWSIVAALYEELRSWLITNKYRLAPVGEEYTVIINDRIVVDDVFEGDVQSTHIKVRLTYMRRYE